MVSSVRAGMVLIARELRRIVHDPAALLAVLVAPFLLAVITSVSLGARPVIRSEIGLAGVPTDAGVLARYGARASASGLSLRAVPSQNAVALVADGSLAAAVVVPADPKTPVRVIGAPDAQIAREVATSIARTISVVRAGDAPAAIPVTAEEPGRKPLDGAEVYGPVIAVFFVLFGVGSVSRRLQSERIDGTLSRLLVSPIRPSVVFVSKAIMMLLVGIVEVVVVIATTTWLFGADWGNVGGVVLVTFAVVMFGIVLATAIAGISRSAVQAQGLEMAVALALVALGGHMVPLRNLPNVATTVAHFTPNGAAIDSFENIASGEGSLASQLTPVVIVLAYAAAVGIVGFSRIRRVLFS